MKQTTLLASLLLTSCAATTVPAPRVDSSVVPPAAARLPRPAASTPVPGPQDGTATVAASVLPAVVNRVTLYVGARVLDGDDWAPAEEQRLFGIGFAHEAPDSAIGWELGLAGSAGDGSALGSKFDGRTREFYGGIVKSFQTGDSKLRPYVGGGLAVLTAELEGPAAKGDDTSLAAYVHGGVAVQLTRAFYLGLDLRLLFGSDITVFGVDADADYIQSAFFLGWSF